MAMNSVTAREPARSGLVGKLAARRRALGVVVLAGGVAAGLWYAYSARFGQAPPAAATARPGPRGPSVPVAVADIAKGEFPVVLRGLGTVTPLATSVVKTQISGQLIEIKFTEGQAVKAGDVLAQVDPRPYRLALSQAEGQLQRDLSLLRNAERDLTRYESLRHRVKDAISEQQIDTQTALISQYKGTVAIDQAQVDQARLNLGYCSIVSLIEGRVGLRLVDPGNYVQPNDANGIVVVTRLKPITVIFTLPENQLQGVLRKFRSGAKLTVAAYDHERAIELAKGELVAIDNQINSSTGTVKLRAEFPNDDERLYPNQFVNAELSVETLKDVVLAPAAAIQRGAAGPFVYAIKPDDTVAVRPVKLGAAGDERVIVEQGLESGERVVVEGADRLREGAKIVLPAAGRGDQTPGGQRPPRKSEKS